MEVDDDSFGLEDAAALKLLQAIQCVVSQDTKMEEEGAAAEPLPPDWTERTSTRTGKTYFVYRGRSQFTQWTPPPAASVVGDHYDAIANSGESRDRDSSSAADARRFNNWAKGRLADLAVKHLPHAGSESLCVLDLAGGKGSGLTKWRQGRPVAAYILVDLSAASVAIAHARFKTMQKTIPTLRHTQFQGICADVAACGSRPGSLPLSLRRGRFRAHVTTIHFALNYMAGGLATTQAVMRLAAEHTRPGGILVVTFTNWDRLQEVWQDETRPLQKSLFRVQRPEGEGAGYVFSLPGCVDCREFKLSLQMLETAAIVAGWTPLRMWASLLDISRDAGFTERGVPEPTGATSDLVGVYGAAIFDWQPNPASCCTREC